MFKAGRRGMRQRRLLTLFTHSSSFLCAPYRNSDASYRDGQIHVQNKTCLKVEINATRGTADVLSTEYRRFSGIKKKNKAVVFFFLNNNVTFIFDKLKQL